MRLPSVISRIVSASMQFIANYALMYMYILWEKEAKTHFTVLFRLLNESCILGHCIDMGET